MIKASIRKSISSCSEQISGRVYKRDEERKNTESIKRNQKLLSKAKADLGKLTFIATCMAVFSPFIPKTCPSYTSPKAPCPNAL